jgi:hypothetical protein
VLGGQPAAPEAGRVVIEFVAGLCWHSDPSSNLLVISWGANRDSEAWVATINADDVDALLMYN